MPKKTHHVVPNLDGGWDLKKVAVRGPSSILTPSKMPSIMAARSVGTRNQNL
jgi:hypothetical protein